MADHIANQLLEALPTQSTALDETSASSTEQGTAITTEQSSDKVSELEKWSDDLETQLLSGVPKFRKEDPTITSSTLKNAADKLHASILITISSSCPDDNWDDAEANKATLEVANSLSTNTFSMSDCNVDLYQLASLLRATGLFLRWNAQVLQSPHAKVSSPLDLSDNVVTRLKFKSMLLLYAKLLDMEMPLTDEATKSYPDIPRFASIALFRATYGDDVQTVTARTLFINSLDGCSYLMRALVRGGQPVPRLFSVVRNVHHLVACCAGECVPKMELALECLAAEECNKNSNDDGEEKQHGLLEVLVATLAWAFRSQPPFPGNKSDRRSDLALEILRALYALDATTAANNGNSESKPSHETMTQIGIILCDLLQLSSADTRIYQIKLAVVALLLNAPKEYCGYLVNNGGILPLVDIMSYQTSLVVVERTGSSAEDAAAVVPILLVLLKLVQFNESVLELVKDEVFPPSAEEAFQQLATAEIAKGKTEGKVNAKNMAPLDAPRGTLRWKLIRLMTWTESNVKRAACELLYTLCGNDATQFVLRTGFGNAIHFLGIRGCVNLPAGVEM